MTDIPPPKAESTVRLRDNGAGVEGRRLGLKGGEVLLAVNGRPFRGTDDMLARRFDARGGKPLALTFARGMDEFVVLAETHKLGRWEIVAAGPLPTEDGTRIDPDTLRNFEVMRADTGVYDLYPETPSLTAMLAAPVWLLQMRLWVPWATVVAALAAAALVTPWLSGAVWMAAGLWVRRAGAFFVRADRRGRGLAWEGMIAARTEAEAHQKHRARYPEDRNIFAPAPAEKGEAEAA